jgi:hypothetical protein
MRPMSASSNSESENILILDQHNFDEWKFELENLCERKKADTEKAKFAWLVKAVNSSDKRIVMKYKSGFLTAMVKEGDVTKTVEYSGNDYPYTWAIGALEKAVVKANASTKDEMFIRQESEKERLKELTIAKCNYDLDLFYKEFDSRVNAALSIGCELPEKYLLTLFSEGCQGHRDLKIRASLVHAEDQKIKNYTDLKIAYKRLIKDRGDEKRNDSERGQQLYSQTFTMKCYNCKSPSHLVENCPKPIKKCSYCGLIGHISEECRKRSKKEEKGSSHATKSNGKETKVNFDTEDEEKDDMGNWKYAAKGLMNKSKSDYSWVYLDTCATFSMTGDRSLLTEIRPWKGEVSGGDKSSRNIISAIGKMILKVTNEKGENSIVEILNVRYVENFSVTLIRPQQLWKDMKITCNFYQGIIIGPDERLIGNIAEDELFLPYILNCKVVHEHAKTLISKDIWHERFGHLSSDYVNIMHSKELVKGLSIDSSRTDEKCEICPIMNNARNPFTRIEDVKTRSFGEVLSLDIDELPVISVEGYRYRLDGICHGSNWIWTFGLSKRDEAKKHIIFLVKRLRNTLIQIRVDGAKEFIAKCVKEVCQEFGIEFKITDPYIHEQNGKVERSHLNIDSKVRAWLKRAGLPKTLWFKASKTAVHVLNRSVTKALNFEKTPYEIKEGVKPSVKHFRIFGCKAYVHIPEEKRSKLDEQGIPAIFVGYSDTSSGYEFYNLQTCKFFTAGSAIFNEKSFPGFNMTEEYKEYLVYDLDPNDEEYVQDNEISEDSNEIGLEENNENENNEEINENANDLEENEENENEYDLHENENQTENELDSENNERSENDFDDEKKNEHRDNGLRRSARIQEQNERKAQGIQPKFGYYLKMEGKEGSLNYKDAVKSSRWREYKLAMIDFMEKLDENNGFSIVLKPDNANIIGSRWVFTDKYDASGTFLKAKARLTPLGYQQEKGIDYKETFAPVVMATSSRLIHILGLKWGRAVKSFDVENAFQLTKLSNETVFMEIPEGFEYFNENFNRKTQCLLLHNAINGLKQSGNEFYKKLNLAMRELGFQNLKSDPCVYFKMKDEKMIIVGVHVDDAKFVSQTEEMENEFVSNFNLLLKTSGSGICDEFLKTRIVQTKDFVSFDQTTKIINYCEQFQVTKPYKSFEMNIEEIMKDNRKFNDHKKYLSAIGGLLYLAGSYRPDISTAVGQLASFNQNPNESAWRAVIRLYGFLLETKDLKLCYDKKSFSEKFKIDVYVDASFNDPHLKNRSRSGYLILVNGCLISWYSKKQSLLAVSTEEAEVYAANEAAKSVSWLLNFMNELNLQYEVPVMHEDCNNAILWINEKRSTMRSKHFNLRLHFIRDLVEDNMLKVQYISTDQNAADMMTKVLGKNKHELFSRNIGLRNINLEEVLN